MKTEVVGRVVYGGIRVDDPTGMLDELVGREVLCKLTQPRNPRFHRKFFAMLSRTLEMIPEDYTIDQWRAVVMVGIAHCDILEDQGTTMTIPNSIAFASMDETEFSRIYRAALDYIAGRIGDDPDHLEQLLHFL